MRLKGSILFIFVRYKNLLSEKYRIIVIMKNKNIVCPKCQSDNAVRKRLPIYLSIIALLAFWYPESFKRECYCIDCDYKWK